MDHTGHHCIPFLFPRLTSGAVLIGCFFLLQLLKLFGCFPYHYFLLSHIQICGILCVFSLRKYEFCLLCRAPGCSLLFPLSLLWICFLLFICFVSLRTWPGIPTTTLVGDSDRVTVRETASVTTAKTTLGHIAAVEARDAAYKVDQWERALMRRCVCVDGVSVIAVDLYRYG